jgi:hypothetical protein
MPWLSGFQSIGVTKEWRPHPFPFSHHHHGYAFPINRRHQRMATQAARAVAAQGGPRAFARSPILGHLAAIVYPVENLEIRCGAVERAAARKIGVSCLRQICALRSGGPPIQVRVLFCPGAAAARSQSCLVSLHFTSTHLLIVPTGSGKSAVALAHFPQVNSEPRSAEIHLLAGEKLVQAT